MAAQLVIDQLQDIGLEGLATGRGIPGGDSMLVLRHMNYMYVHVECEIIAGHRSFHDQFILI